MRRLVEEERPKAALFTDATSEFAGFSCAGDLEMKVKAFELVSSSAERVKIV